MKDIFIDAQIANQFASPPDRHFEDLIIWLTGEKAISSDAYLMLSNKLIGEYLGGCQLSQKSTSIGVILNLILAENRYIKISPQQIKDFQAKFFNKKIWKDLQCKQNKSADPDHIAVIFLSPRKVALSQDINLTHDLVNFPKFKKLVTVFGSPEDFLISKFS